MRRLLTSCAAIILVLSCSQAFAEEGGYKDPNTGKVWVRSPHSASDWISAVMFAANLGVWDLNSQGVMTYYDDWRLPTVAELQTAIANGTIQWINQNNGDYMRTGRFSYWTSTTQGKNKAYMVWVQFNSLGEVVVSQSGQSEAVLQKPGFGAYIGAFIVRP